MIKPIININRHSKGIVISDELGVVELTFHCSMPCIIGTLVESDNRQSSLQFSLLPATASL